VSPPNDKPNAASLRWEIRDSDVRFRNETLSLRADNVTVRDGTERNQAYLERVPAVVIVPVTHDGQIITLQQYRYPVDDWCIEVPTGNHHDTGDESLEDTVRKALGEKVGATCGALTTIGFFYSAPSMTDEKCHVFLAENVDGTRTPDLESSEEISIRLVPADEMVAMARAGKVKSGPCTLAVLWCEPLLRDRGYI